MTSDPHEILTPYQYYKLFIASKRIEETVFERNQYHIQSHGKALKPQISGQVVEKFIGCHFRMGLLQMSNQRSYWVEGYTIISSILSRNQLSGQFTLSII